MTKYVINSGGIKNESALKKQFHTEIFKGLGDNPRVLMCNFAQGREYWEVKFDGYTNSIIEDVDCTPSFELAFPDRFVDQVQQADVVYFHGGDSDLLLYWMQQFDLPALFDGKVIATNSASSQMLSKQYYTCDWRACRDDGLGILPIKFISHYQADYSDDPRGPIDWERALNDLENYVDKELPVYALKEGEYAVFEDDKEVEVVRGD